MIKCQRKELYIMKNEKKISKSLKNGIKSCLSMALNLNANSSGCYVIYQPKVPKSLDKFKKFND